MAEHMMIAGVAGSWLEEVGRNDAFLLQVGQLGDRLPRALVVQQRALRERLVRSLS